MKCLEKVVHNRSREGIAVPRDVQWRWTGELCDRSRRQIFLGQRPEGKAWNPAQLSPELLYLWPTGTIDPKDQHSDFCSILEQS